MLAECRSSMARRWAKPPCDAPASQADGEGEEQKEAGKKGRNRKNPDEMGIL